MITKERMFVCFSFVNKIVKSIAPPNIRPSGLINHPPPPAYAGSAEKISIAENDNIFIKSELDILPLFGVNHN